MKKMLFSALACVAFAGSAFASNEIVLENEIQDNKVEKNNQTDFYYDPCIVEIWGYNGEGEWILKRTYKIRIYPYKSCDEAITAINKTLNPNP